MTAAGGLASPSHYPLSALPRARVAASRLPKGARSPLPAFRNFPAGPAIVPSVAREFRNAGTAGRRPGEPAGTSGRGNDGREILPGRRDGGTGVAREFRESGTPGRRSGDAAGTSVRRNGTRAGIPGRRDGGTTAGTFGRDAGTAGRLPRGTFGEMAARPGSRAIRFLPMVDRRHYPVRRRRLQDPEDYSALDALTPSARMAMVWPLTLQAWAFFTELADEPRLRRDVGRVTRGGR